MQRGGRLERFSESLRGRFSQHLHFSDFYNLANVAVGSRLEVNSRDDPPHELVIFGGTVLEDVNETFLPRFQYIRLLPGEIPPRLLWSAM